MAISREVSRSLATGDDRGAARLAHGTLRAFALATVPLVAIMVALSPVLSHLLKIHSTSIVVLAVLSLSTALVYPVAMGVLQGQQRFVPLASLYVIPWVVRLVVLGIAAAAGYRLGGAVFAVLLVQMGLGELQYRTHLPWGLVLVHVAVAATVWAATVAFVTLMWRPQPGLLGRA
jgi:hypothetical protein